MATSRYPHFESLLKWLNTFETDETLCSKPEDLSSGHYLLACLATLCPDVGGSDSDPWTDIMKKLEGYCGGPLDKALSLDAIKQGDIEQIIKVVVLVLCFLVEEESANQVVIERIMQLPEMVQQDLKAIIESGMVAVEGGLDVVASNTFLSPLMGETPPRVMSQTTPTGNKTHRFITPSRASVYHRGLETPAGQRWLASPALSNHKRQISRMSLAASSAKKTRPSEDLLALQHRLELTEQNFKSEKVLTDELSSDLQLVNQTCKELQAANTKLSLKVTSLETRHKDLNDELQFKERKLQEWESKSRQEGQRFAVLRETSKQLETRLADYETVKSQLKQQMEKHHQLEILLAEKEAELRKLSVNSENKMAELSQAAMSNERSFLEVAKEQEELLKEYEAMKRKHEQLQNAVQLKSDELKTCNDQMASLSNKLDSLTAANTALQTQLSQSVSSEEHESYKQKMTEHLNTLHEHNAEVLSKLESVCQERNQIKAELGEQVEALEKTEADLRARLEKQSNENQERVKANCELTIKLDRLTQEHRLYRQEMSEQTSALSGRNADLEARLGEACEELESLKTQLHEASQQHDEYKHEVAEEINTLQATNASLSVSLNKACEKDSTLRQQLETMERSTTKLQSQLDTIHREHEAYKVEMDKQIRESESSNARLRTKLDTTSSEHDLYKQQVSGEMGTLRSAYSTLETHLANIKEKYNNYKQQVEILSKSKTDLEARIAMAHQEHQSYKTEMEGLVKNLEHDKGDLQAKVDTVSQEHNSFKLKTNIETLTLKKTCAELQAKLASAKQDCDTYQQASCQVATLQKTCTQLEADLRKSCQENVVCSEKLLASKDEHAKLQVTLDSTSKQYKASKLQVEALTMANARLELKLEDTCKEFKLQEKQVKKQLENLHERNGVLEKELSTTREDYNAYQKRITSQVESMEQVNTKLQNDLQAYKADVTKEMQSRDQDKRDLEAELDAKRKECNEQKALVQTLQLSNDELHSRLNEAHEQQEVQLLKSTIIDLQMQLKAANEHLQDANARRQIAERAKRALENEKMYVEREGKNTEEALKERLMKLQAQLESSNKQCQDSSTRVQILEGSNRQLKNELKLVERELKEQKQTEMVQKPTSPARLQQTSNLSERTQSEGNRVGELQRRNKMTLPHLKSSYPIEMQVKPESPSVSNEIIKNGNVDNKSSTPSKSTAFTVPTEISDSRKRSREMDSSFYSPPASLRRISTPPTPESTTTTTRNVRPTAEALRRAPKGTSSMNLRSYLDVKTTQPPQSSGTSFDITLTPPKGRRQMPKKFRNALNASAKTKTSPPEEQRRQTMVVKPKSSRKKK